MNSDNGQPPSNIPDPDDILRQLFEMLEKLKNADPVTRELAQEAFDLVNAAFLYKRTVTDVIEIVLKMKVYIWGSGFFDLWHGMLTKSALSAMNLISHKTQRTKYLAKIFLEIGRRGIDGTKTKYSIETLKSAIDYSLDNPNEQWLTAQLLIIESLIPSGDFDDLVKECQTVLEIAQRNQDDNEYTQMLGYIILSRLCNRHGFYAEGFNYGQIALTIAYSLQSIRYILVALSQMSNYSMRVPELNNYNQKMLDYWLQQQSFWKNQHDLRALYFGQLGQFSYHNKNYRQSVSNLQIAVELFEAMGSKINLAYTKHYLGMAYIKTQNFDAADDILAQTINIYRELNMDDNWVLAQHWYGWSSYEKGDYEQAIFRLTRALENAKNLSDSDKKERQLKSIAQDIEKSKSYAN